MTIAEILDKARVGDKSSFAALAARLGVTRRMIYLYYDGSSKPAAPICEKIAQLTGVDVNDVLVAAGHLRPNNPVKIPAEADNMIVYFRQLGDKIPLETLALIENEVQAARERQEARRRDGRPNDYIRPPFGRPGIIENTEE